MPSVVFLFPWYDEGMERFGALSLYLQGFPVSVWDCSLLLGMRQKLDQQPGKNFTTSHCARVIASFDDLDALVRERARDSVFIDYLVGLSHFTWQNERVFRILKKHGARYYIIAASPIPNRVAVPPGRLHSLARSLRGKIGPRKIRDYLLRTSIFLLRRYGDAYPLPHRIFGIDNEIMQNHLRKYRLNSNALVPIHSLDYDAYLDFVESREQHREKKICVFLDEAATDHPDFTYLRMPLLEKDRYFESMRRFFDEVEKRPGLEVVIAAHPRSHYEETPDVFGNRPVIKGRTIRLVSEASLVIAHASTAVNFAVLFDKPLFLVRTTDMIQKDRSLFSEVMAEALGMTSINVDEPEIMERLLLAPVGELKTRYETYTYTYIKSRSAPELRVWEIVGRAIRDDLSDPNRN